MGTKRVAEMDVLAIPAFGPDNQEFTLGIRSENIRPENRDVGHRYGHILFEQKFVSMAWRRGSLQYLRHRPGRRMAPDHAGSVDFRTIGA